MINFSLQDVTGGNAGSAAGAAYGGRPSFAQTFMQMFQQMTEMQRQRQLIETAQEERDYKKKFHQHEIKSLDLQDRKNQLEAKLKAAGLDYGTGEAPAVDLTGFEDLGFPSMMYKPPSLKDRLARKAMEDTQAAEAARQKQEAENTIPVGPEAAGMIPGLKEGKYNKALLDPILKTLMSRVNVPAMPGGGTMGPAGVPAGDYDKEALDLFAKQFDKDTVGAGTKFTEGGANARATLQRQNNIDVANIRATQTGGRYGTGVGGDDDAVTEWAKKLSMPGTTVSIANVPMGLRNLVMKKLGASDAVLMSKPMMDKFAQFIPAEAAINELDAAVDEYSKSSITEDPVQTAVLGLKLKAKIGAFSRLIGRATGEKGVFTDEDAQAFKDYLAPLGILGATLDPDMAKSSLADARALMQKTKENTLKLATTPMKDPNAKPGAAKPSASPSPVAGGGQPIVQKNSTTGEYRYSLDGGATWKAGKPPGGGY